MGFEIEGNKLIKYNHKKGDEIAIIPEGIEIIGKEAFQVGIFTISPKSLKEVVLPQSLKIIEEAAFERLDVDRIVIQEGLKEIRKRAFYKCSIKEIFLPDSLEIIGEEAFKGCENLEEIVVPPMVQILPREVFSECCELKKIILPNGLTTIEEYIINMDKKMQYLSIPKTVTTIKPGAFKNYIRMLYGENIAVGVEVIIDDNNENYVTSSEGVVYTRDMKTLLSVPCNCGDDIFIIPEGIEVISPEAFLGNEKIRKIVIPESVTEIGEYAFAYSHINDVTLPITIENMRKTFAEALDLKRITFVQNDSNISYFNISNLYLPSFKVKIYFPSEVWQNLHKSLLSKELIVDYWTKIKSEDPKEIASIMIYQDSKAWNEWVEGYGGRADEIVSAALVLLEKEKKITVKIAKKITTFATKYAKETGNNVLNKLILELKNKGQKKLAEEFENSVEIKRIICAESINPIEQFVDENIGEVNSKLEKDIKGGIKYANGNGISSDKAVKLIIAQYKLQWERNKVVHSGGMGSVETLAFGYRLQKDEIADKVAEALNRDELMELLEQKVYGPNYREYIIAYTRYADEKHIEGFINSINTRSKGNAKERWWVESAFNALFLSDCLNAADFMDKNNCLKRYAEMRGHSEGDYRDSVMVENFGFDDRGVISFDIGDNTIELSISEDAQIRLFDVASQNYIKSFPKKSGNMDKLTCCNEQYNELKTRIEDFISRRIETLNKLYLEDQSVSNNIWVNQYLKHPIIKVLTRLLVWKDINNKSFVVTDKGIFDVNNQEYSPSGDIRLAHVLEMDEAEINEWRLFLAERKQKQLFVQIWEPVAKVEINTIRERYEGNRISNKERNDLKKCMKMRGIEIKSLAQEKVYNHRTGKYEFSNEGTMRIGTYGYLNYTVDEQTKDLILGTLKINCNNRVLNVVGYELDKACIMSNITKDEVDHILTEQLDLLNLAQINVLINRAIECKAVKCTAMIMDYKNKKYPDFNWLDELIIEL